MNRRERWMCASLLAAGLTAMGLAIRPAHSTAPAGPTRMFESSDDSDSTDGLDASSPKAGDRAGKESSLQRARPPNPKGIVIPGQPDFSGRKYPPAVYMGAMVLHMDVDFVAACIEALEAVYERDYKGAKAKFDAIGARWPGSGVAPVGRALIWQALMLENFDFKYWNQYRVAYRQARQELEQAIVQPGNDAWEYFLLGGILGVDAIDTMRHGEYLTALNRAIEALAALQKTKELAPDFKDTLLGDGLYNYWRSVLTRRSKILPDFADRRQEGIDQLTTVERQGIFLRPPATLALTFTWEEEGNWREALKAALRNQRRYPDNVINNLVLGQIYLRMRKYPLSEAAFQRVLAVSPTNQRVHYYLGRLYLRWKKLDQAEASFDRFLAFDDLADDERAYGFYYKGNVYWRRHDWENAEACYRQAWKTGHLASAKARLERIREKQKSQ